MRVDIIPDFTNLFLQLISTIIIIAIPVFIIYIVTKHRRKSDIRQSNIYDLIENLEKRIEDLEKNIDKK